MALTDQPYLPLYVDDWMNNNNLKLSTAGASRINGFDNVHNAQRKLIWNNKFKSKVQANR